MMATIEEFESLDEEVKELIQNYRYKKSTTYEPCTVKNFKDCLIGLHQEFELLNLNYVFNPYIDVNFNTLQPESLVNLINAVWTLLHTHKNLQQKVNQLEEQNYILENNNKHLNAVVNRLREKVTHEKNESKACVASAQRIADHSDGVLQKLTDTQTKLAQITKQKESNERRLQNEITRLKLLNEKLTDRLRDKDIHSHPNKTSYAACRDIKSNNDEYLKHLKGIISKLERNNQTLLQEVVQLKEELILGGMHQFSIDKD